MSNLYTVVASNQSQGLELSNEEIFSVIYHNIFDYPLNFSELIKWKLGEGISKGDNLPAISNKNGYFFVDNRSGLIYKRILRSRISTKKIEIANRAAKVLSFIPSIRFIGVTGSLAMNNSNEESDIDLLLVTKKGTLWTTRLISYLLIGLFGIPFRRASKREEKNKLCLNMWLDEGDLAWPKEDRNIYTAHEIAQIKPLINKNKTFENLLWKNKWLLRYWPNSVKIGNLNLNGKWNNEDGKSKQNILEKISYQFQYQFMKKKISREVITSSRAIFHPQDWGSIVLNRLAH